MDVVIGAGMGGLCAAISLARAGREVTVIEARDGPGGLAAGFEREGRTFDGGPYVLLDQPGLAWAFEQLGEALEDHVELVRLDEVYRVRTPAGTIRVHRDADATAEGLERAFPGSARPYLAFVREMAATYERLAPLQRGPRPRPWSLLRHGRWRHTPFLLRPLGAVLARAGLPGPVRDALGIWTHIAGQPLDEAPSPLAFVPAIVHTVGAYTVRGGIGRIPLALERIARRHGVTFRYGAAVERIPRSGRRVEGVVVAGQVVKADLVVSNAPAVATLCRLVSPADPRLTTALSALPLQSPGVGAWMTATEVDGDLPFLEFWLPGGDEKVRLRVLPGVVDPTRRGTARLVHPLDHLTAEVAGEDGQREYLRRVLDEPWWREGLADVRVLETRIPVEWGRAFHLWRDSMNPVMTAAFMRQGRIPHHGLLADNLHLVGSATHPGQWVSFCAISGVVAASQALNS